jgi:hypothetical protein
MPPIDITKHKKLKTLTSPMFSIPLSIIPNSVTKFNGRIDLEYNPYVRIDLKFSAYTEFINVPDVFNNDKIISIIDQGNNMMLLNETILNKYRMYMWGLQTIVIDFKNMQELISSLEIIKDIKLNTLRLDKASNGLSPFEHTRRENHRTCILDIDTIIPLLPVVKHLIINVCHIVGSAKYPKYLKSIYWVNIGKFILKTNSERAIINTIFSTM